MRTVVITTVHLALALFCGVSAGLWNYSQAAIPVLSTTTAQADEYEQQVLPLFTKYCFTCHSGEKAKGDLDLSPYKTRKDLFAKLPLAESILTNIRNGDMPPANKPKPSRAELDKLISYLEGEVVKAHLNGKRDPGRVTMRRLNRAEYNNTIRDLLEVD
ncbi:MAG TPA: c-type cytochrome, partial [Gemmatales bacterium]|nr:c-type cytochrome [Gemmatales bacterium]